MLRSVDPIQVARFLKKRERYDLEIISKQTEVPSLKVLPYIVSIDRSLLKNLSFLGQFDTIAAEAESDWDLTDSNIKTYVEAHVAGSESEGTDRNVIEGASAATTSAMITMRRRSTSYFNAYSPQC